MTAQHLTFQPSLGRVARVIACVRFSKQSLGLPNPGLTLSLVGAVVAKKRRPGGLL